MYGESGGLSICCFSGCDEIRKNLASLSTHKPYDPTVYLHASYFPAHKLHTETIVDVEDFTLIWDQWGMIHIRGMDLLDGE
jgi:hypothetical protein